MTIPSYPVRRDVGLDVGDLRRVLRQLPVLVFAFDVTGYATLSEGGLVGALGFEPGELVGQGLPVFERLYPSIIHNVGRALRGESFTTRSAQSEFEFALDVTWRPDVDEDGRVVGMVGVATRTDDTFDATALHRAQDEYRALVAAFPDHMFRLTTDGRAVTLKTAASPDAAQPRITWVLAPVTTILPDEVALRVRDAADRVRASGEPEGLEYSEGPPAERSFLEARILPETDENVLVVVRDITRRRAMEAELSQSSKLEALGRLSAGVAHEINTPIQFVSHNVEFVSEAFGAMHELLLAYRQALDISDPRPWNERNAELAAREQELDVSFLLEEVPQAVEETLQGMRRVSRIVRAMQAFSHPSARELAPADLNDAVSHTVVVSASHHKYVADVELELGELPPVVCVTGEITQVLLNLVVNASQAIAEQRGHDGGRGTITITTRHEGDEVLLSVGDDGPGIAPEDQERVFDAFFTTKEVGVGTGQGLTLTRSIVVDRHHGRIDLISAPGEGTTFEIRLPVAGPTGAVTAPEPGEGT